MESDKEIGIPDDGEVSFILEKQSTQTHKQSNESFFYVIVQ